MKAADVESKQFAKKKNLGISLLMCCYVSYYTSCAFLFPCYRRLNFGPCTCQASKCSTFELHPQPFLLFIFHAIDIYIAIFSDSYLLVIPPLANTPLLGIPLSSICQTVPCSLSQLNYPLSLEALLFDTGLPYSLTPINMPPFQYSSHLS